MFPIGYPLAGSQMLLSTKEGITGRNPVERAVLSDYSKNITFAKFTKNLVMGGKLLGTLLEPWQSPGELREP